MGNNSNSVDFYLALGASLRALRMDRNWSLAQLSFASGISEHMLQSFELGKWELDVLSFCRIAQSLDVAPDAVLTQAIDSYCDPYLPCDTGLSTLTDNEAYELLRNFLHVEGPARGSKFRNMVKALKK